MDSHLCGVELAAIEAMTRAELLEAVRRRSDCLPPTLREGLDEKPDGWLRLLLLAARIIYAL
ncbi:MAG TPA: hypothetical protein VFW33_14065, partial [Gemmataceae bacterium]|nr:hypothetical protein [Gemmataceae bacterium]